MPLPTLAAQITSAGISAPTYDQIKQSLEESFRAIFGADVYITPDSQDGQMIALFASAINDSNLMAIAVYNATRPSFAQGAGLSSGVKINGIRRKVASESTAVGNVVGVNGTVINSGVVQDTNGNKWDLPPVVNIPGAGFIAVTVTAQEPGSLSQPVGSINQIATPTLGWQSFVSTSDSVPGDPVESDAALRKRQTVAAALPNNTPLGGLQAALEALAGVTEVRVYENATNGVDANGLPARSIAVVIEGGDVAEIAEVIGQKKTPGAATFGSTAQGYVDPITGIAYVINFYVLAYQAVSVEISLTAGVGWSTDVATQIQQTVSDYLNGLGIGQEVTYGRVWAPSYLNGAPEGQTFEISVLTVNGAGVDVAIPFNKAASCDPSNVVITVLP